MLDVGLHGAFCYVKFTFNIGDIAPAGYESNNVSLARREPIMRDKTVELPVYGVCTGRRTVLRNAGIERRGGRIRQNFLGLRKQDERQHKNDNRSHSGYGSPKTEIIIGVRRTQLNNNTKDVRSQHPCAHEQHSPQGKTVAAT